MGEKGARDIEIICKLGILRMSWDVVMLRLLAGKCWDQLRLHYTHVVQVRYYMQVVTGIRAIC